MADHPVTRNGDCNAVSRAGSSDGAHGLRAADFFSDLRVARCGTSGDFPQCLPHALLKCSPSNIKRQSQAELRCFYEAHDGGDPFFKLVVATHQLGFAEAILQIR